MRRSKPRMIAIRDLSESRMAFFWIGAPGKVMPGPWETETGPQ